MRKKYTPAERALQLICAKAGVPFEEFQKLFEASQSQSYRDSPESSYKMVQSSYLPEAAGHEDLFKLMHEHIVSPKSGFGKGSEASEMQVDIAGYKVALGAMVLKPQEMLDAAIVGVTENGALIYDRELVIELYAREAGWTPESCSEESEEAFTEAVEWVCYNIDHTVASFKPKELRVRFIEDLKSDLSPPKAV